MTRREVIALASSGLLGGLPLKAAELENLSYPLRMLEGAITPPNLLFVRDHFKEPDVSVENWKLRIDGDVDSPYEIGFADLVEMPSTKVEAVLECAGNAANGSAVSNGVWEGVSMPLLLEQARPSAQSDHVALEGADLGTLMQDGQPLPYSQIVPLSKCKHPSSLVAYKYNDLALPKRNGFPARALFPGWYGMNSVKWLRRITVLGASTRDTSFERSGMNRLYNRVEVHDGAEKVTRVSSLLVKSVMAWPTDGLKLPAARYTVRGFAWSGNGAVQALALSVDGGRNWHAANLAARGDAHSWVQWSYDWNAIPGDYTLMSRATDAAGNQQPVLRDPARKDGYEVNWCSPVHCTVR